MPRVLLAGFCAVPNSDRAGVQTRHVLRALAESYAVDVLTVREGERAYVEQIRTTRMLRVPVPPAALRERVETYRRALRRQLEAAEYSAVHCCDAWSAAPALELRRQLGYLVVYDVARCPVQRIDDASLAREHQREKERCVLDADLVLAPTDSAVRYLVAKSARAVCLVAPGVDVDTFDWDRRDSSRSAVVLYAGPIGRERGLDVLLRAMSEVCARADASLRLVGEIESDFAEVLEDAIAARGLRDRVSVGPAVDNGDMPREIARATLCVAPIAAELSRHPDALYPTKLLEYMACQRPVVAPRQGTVTSLMHDGEHGLLFAPNDATDLAAQILRLLADGALATQIARAGYRLVRDHHTASATRRALRDAYRAIESRMPTYDTDPPLSVPAPLSDHGAHDITESQIRLAAPSGGDAVVEAADQADGFATHTVVTRPAGDEAPIAKSDGSHVGDQVGEGDEWVVRSGPLENEPSLAQSAITEETTLPPVPLSPADEPGPVDDRRPRPEPDSAPLGNRFAAGEIEVPGTLEAPAEPSESASFTAAGPILPGPASDQADESAADNAGRKPDG